MICTFDCETIPDSGLLRTLFGYEGSDLEVSIEAQRVQEEKTGNGFLPVIFHKVVAISAVISDDFGKFDRVSSIDGDDEESLLKSFLGFIDKKNPKLISFNGRSFDLPMLLVRALKYNISCPSYFDTNNRQLNKSKWENYRARYSDVFHIDLMDSISEYGAVRGLKLDEICVMAGLPGKFDVHGDQVMELFYKNELEKIRQYCESDVLNTFWLFLKYEILKGNLTAEDYLNSLNLMSEKLDIDKNYTEIFQEKIANEIEKYA